LPSEEGSHDDLRAVRTPSGRTAKSFPLGSVSHLLASLDVYPDKVKGIADIGDWSANNLEQIVTLNPDLIVAPVYAKPEQIDMLAKIAPTVIPPYTGLDVFQRLNGIGDILGKKKEAEAWVAAFDAKAKTTKEKLKSSIREGETAAIFQITGKRFMVYGSRNVGHVIYNVLGFVPPAPVKAKIAADVNFNIADISMEVLPEYAADRIFVVSTSNDADADKKLKELTDSAIWKILPAVKNNRVYTLSDKWTQYNSLMLDWQLDDALKQLTR
ncbi:MAG: ABC transporter substrate-binding protein, partial [Paenibacillaceae bacterium]|nr:ABC transporter substrate-binding protein [Paenibacillaceae bacterium]